MIVTNATKIWNCIDTFLFKLQNGNLFRRKKSLFRRDSINPIVKFTKKRKWSWWVVDVQCRKINKFLMENLARNTSKILPFCKFQPCLPYAVIYSFSFSHFFFFLFHIFNFNSYYFLAILQFFISISSLRLLLLLLLVFQFNSFLYVHFSTFGLWSYAS